MLTLVFVRNFIKSNLGKKGSFLPNNCVKEGPDIKEGALGNVPLHFIITNILYVPRSNIPMLCKKGTCDHGYYQSLTSGIPICAQHKGLPCKMI